MAPKEDLQKILAEIHKAIKESKDEVKSEIEGLRKDMQELKETVTQLQHLTKETDSLKKRANRNEEKLKSLETSMLMVEYKMTEKHLRFRGIPEGKNEDLYTLMYENLGAFLDDEEIEIEREIDLIYRVNSLVAVRQKLPRDIVVQFNTRRTRDKILNKSYSQELKIESKKITVLKEIPKKILKKRKEYRELIDFLGPSARFRWEIPEGISFEKDHKRIKILSTSQMRTYLEENKSKD